MSFTCPLVWEIFFFLTSQLGGSCDRRGSSTPCSARWSVRANMAADTTYVRDRRANHPGGIVGLPPPVVELMCSEWGVLNHPLHFAK